MNKIGVFLVASLLISGVVMAFEFSDNFDDGNYFGWLESFTVDPVSVWQVESGELLYTYESEDFGIGTLYTPVGAITDFTCECLLTKKSTGRAFTTGIMRFSELDYYIVWQVCSNNAVMLAYCDGGAQQELHSEMITMGESWHTMKLQVSGSTPTLTLTAWWDGVQKWTGDITVSEALAQGHICLFASGDTASMWFDDVSMTYESYGVKENQTTGVPSINLLSQSIPNPSIYQTRIEYTIPTASKIQLKIYNALGEIVRTLVNETKSAGRHEIIWDGKDEQGRRLPTGNYFYQLITDKSTSTKKLILLK